MWSFFVILSHFNYFVKLSIPFRENWNNLLIFFRWKTSTVQPTFEILNHVFRDLYTFAVQWWIWPLLNKWNDLKLKSKHKSNRKKMKIELEQILRLSSQIPEFTLNQIWMSFSTTILWCYIESLRKKNNHKTKNEHKDNTEAKRSFASILMHNLCLWFEIKTWLKTYKCNAYNAMGFREILENRSIGNFHSDDFY